jgi:MerR family transcriptional regulator/heat shock protein HspR
LLPLREQASLRIVERSWEERLDDHDEPVYPIGVVAELLNVSVQVVRRYDDHEVVEPERSHGGQRRYSRRDIARLSHVLELADEGISIAGIRRILDLERQLEDRDAPGGQRGRASG